MRLKLDIEPVVEKKPAGNRIIEPGHALPELGSLHGKAIWQKKKETTRVYGPLSTITASSALVIIAPQAQSVWAKLPRRVARLGLRTETGNGDIAGGRW